MKFANTLKQENLSYELIPINLREIIFFKEAPCDIYGYLNGLFIVVMKKNDPISKEMLSHIIKNGVKEIFVKYQDEEFIQKRNRDQLIKKTRSLSMGDVDQNAKMQIQFLMIGLSKLYNDPGNDENLKIQYQAVKNLCAALINEDALDKKLFQQMHKHPFHYTISHPLLSSLFLLGYLKSLGQFSDKEFENLFITNYFKDIGMSCIKEESLNTDNLNEKEKQLLITHEQFSAEILSHRLLLSANSIEIIKNHHHFSKLSPNKEVQVITGIETVLINAIDTFIAMTSERPYRKAFQPYEALKVIKDSSMKDHFHEFSLLVQFIRKFFS